MHRVLELYITPTMAQRHPDLVADDCGAFRLYEVTDEVAAAISPNAQGVAAVLSSESLGIEDALAHPDRWLRQQVVILVEARDPGNVGTVIRVASAAGAGAVVLAGDSVDPDNPKVIRSSVGAVFHVPVAKGVGLEEAIDAVRGLGMRVLAADGAGDLVLGEGSVSLAALAAPTAWVFGNEAHGLSAAELALVDDVVRIPMLGGTESLNLASAATLCLYAGIWPTGT